MRNLKKDMKIGALVLVAALVVAQFIPVEKANPPARADIPADPEVKSMLKRACYDCHSNQTVWPWYSNVAPASWLLANDVNEGRESLNFSEWAKYSGEDQREQLEDIAEEVESGKMPLWYYSIFHGESKLTAEERNRIKNWASGAPAGESEP